MAVSAGQVEIAVSIDGAEEVLRRFRDIEATANKLDGRKVKVTADASVRAINKQIAQLDRQQFEYKRVFAENISEAKRLTKQIDVLDGRMAHAGKRATRFGYGIQRGLASEFDVLTKDGEQLDLASNKIYSTQLKLNKSLKAGTTLYKGHVSSLRDVSGWVKKYNSYLTEQMGLISKRGALNTNWDDYFAQLNKFKTTREGLMAARESYQALGKEADVTNKLAKSMPPVVEKFKQFQGQLQSMDRSSALTSVNGKIQDVQHTLSLIQSKRAELGLPTGSEETDYAHKLASSQLASYEKFYNSQLRYLSSQQKGLLEFDAAQRQVETNIVRFGSRMQSLGNGLQRLTSPFMNVYRGLTMGIGYRALNSLMQGISGAFSRYDTMKTYGIVLSELGMDASKKFSVGMGNAQTAVENLNDAVVGLPTGLDEIVASMRVYAGATGEVEKATKLAIAANNAYIAGGMDSRQQLYTQRQLLALAGGEELQSSQWSSIRRNAPMAFRAVAKEMKVSVRELSKGLKDGTINGQKFLDVFIKVGTEGRIANAAQKMKQTWDAVSQNIQNAFNRMGEGILTSLDNVFKRTDGRTFLQHVLGVDKDGNYIGGGIKGFIDDLSQSAQSWISSNPDKITKFFDDLANIDWKGIISGFASFGLEFSSFLASLGKFVNGDVIKTMLRLNLLGKGISIFGSFARGLAGPASKIYMNGGILTYAGIVLRKLVGMLPFAKKLAAWRDSLLKGTETAGDVAQSMQKLTWTGIANKALNIGSVFVVAESMKIMAQAMQEFGKVKFSPDMVGSIGTATLIMGGMAKFITSLGATIGAAMSTTGGKIILGGTALAETALLGIGKTFEMFGKGIEGIGSGVRALKDLNTMDIPKPEKIVEIGKAFRALTSAFDTDTSASALGDAITAWSKGLQAENIKKIADALDSIEKLSTLELSEDAVEKAEANFEKIQIFSLSLMNLFSDQETEQRAKSASTPHEASYQGKHNYTFWKQEIGKFADTISDLSGIFTDMSTMLLGLKTLNKQFAHLNKLKSGEIQPFDWDVLRLRIANLADNIYSFADNSEDSPFWKLQQAASKLKGANYTKLTELFTELPKVMRSLQNIDNTFNKLAIFKPDAAGTRSLINTPGSGKSAVSSLADKLKPVMEAISTIADNMPKVKGLKKMKTVQTALTRVRTVIGQLKRLSENTNIGGINVASIQDAANKINEALAPLEEIGQKDVTVSLTIKGDIKNEAETKIKEAVDAIEKAINSADKLPKTKNIPITFKITTSGVADAIAAARGAVDTVKDAIANIPSVVNKSIRVNFVGGGGGHASQYHNGGVIYRADGGNIFRPQGTDTVPAMLTPGEFVVRRSSAQALGYGLLSRMNHMDIKGALNSLALRAGQSLRPTSSNVVNNNTTNYNRDVGGITLNNYNSGGVGLAKASRWVKSL